MEFMKSTKPREPAQGAADCGSRLDDKEFSHRSRENFCF
jgi:hypothetical protein